MGVVSGPGGLESNGRGIVGLSNTRPLQRRIYRFGSFELKTETGELSKRGIRLRLQTKPLQILELLLSRPGELITREELCNRLWPETYVDFESGLNTAVNRLRVALGDSADAPRYIETLPRLGYRFLSPVEVLEEPASVPAVFASSALSSVPQQTSQIVNPAPSFLTSEQRKAGLRDLLKPVGAIGILIVVAGALFTVSFLRSKPESSRTQPKFRQLTFRSGKIVNARFSPDPDKVIYTARWRPEERATYLLDLKDTSSRVLPFVPGTVEAVSSRGDLLFASMNKANPVSALSRIPISGGNPTILAEQTRVADFDRTGRTLAIVRRAGAVSFVEFPPGHAIYRSAGWINSLRVAPCGSIVAFLEHPVSDDDGGHVRIARSNGTSRLMTGEWTSIDGLAWAPSGQEIWFTASKVGAERSLYAVSEKGTVRRISNSPLELRLLDISNSGRALVSLDDYRVTMMAELPGSAAETDLSKFDFSYVEDISGDGKLLLFTEGGAGGGQHYTAFVHNEQTHETIRVGPGRGMALSPDKKWVLTIDPEDRSVLNLVPLGPGHPKKIPGDGFQYQWARFAGPDGKKLLVGGSFPNSPTMIGMQLIDNGRPVKLAGIPYMDHVVVSRDGLRLAGLIPGDRLMAADLTTGKLLSRLPHLASIPVAWSLDNRSLYTLNYIGDPGELLRADLETGKTELWKSLGPQDVSGFIGLSSAVAVPEIGAYAYSAAWDLSRMYVVDGWS
jgi:DNA-binding winged helix-turn-helix (wHTH) protein